MPRIKKQFKKIATTTTKVTKATTTTTTTGARKKVEANERLWLNYCLCGREEKVASMKQLITWSVTARVAASSGSNNLFCLFSELQQNCFSVLVYFSGTQKFILPNFGNFLISHLALCTENTYFYLLRGWERLHPAGFVKGMVDWLCKVRLGKFS